MRNNKQLRRLGATLIALVVIFVVMTVTARERTNVTWAEKTIATVLYPLQAGTEWVADRFRGVGQGIQELTHLREENARLREQVQQMAQAESKNELLTQENQTLRSELKLKERSKYPLLSAEVISRSSDNWYHTVQINRGSRDGLEPNMAVVNWQGMVGKISQTTPFTATVQLVIDAGFGQSGFGAGAKIAATGETGVIETVQGGNVRMKFFSADAAVQVGQTVVTSGQAVLPPDLLIGWVDSISAGESAYDKFVNIRPAVDFHKLDVVQVVLHPTDNGGAKTP